MKNIFKAVEFVELEVIMKQLCQEKIIYIDMILRNNKGLSNPIWYLQSIFQSRQNMYVLFSYNSSS